MILQDRRKQLAATGYMAFLCSGICGISSGVIVSILQDKYGFNYSLSGTMLAAMNIGNMLASFAAGILPTKIGTRKTVAFLCAGYFLGYLLMAFFGNPGILMGAFLIAGIAKGCTINNCTVLVGNNSKDRTRGMSLMHACYAFGAMVCPFIITALLCVNNTLPMVGIAIAGLLLWLIFMSASLPNQPTGQKNTGESKEANKEEAKKEKSDFTFLKEPFFWMLTGLIFMQNCGENAVTGWLVTYYKSTGILSGMLSNYTVTVMWGATMIARLLIAFVFHIKDNFKAMAIMGAGCFLLYLGLVNAQTAIPGILLLFGFAFSMAGVNPMGMASAGKMLSPASVGVLIPTAATGAILMPWIIGIVADRAGLQFAMCMNLVPCLGIMVMSLLLRWYRIRHAEE